LGGRGDPGVDELGLDDFQLPSGLGMTDDEAFELYGPGAAIETQTAAQSQWQRAALDSESTNFLGFVKEAIEQVDTLRADAQPGDEEMEELQGTIIFSALLPPKRNNSIVAAQALLHVLALGTKSMLNVQQSEPFGPIELRALV